MLQGYLDCSLSSGEDIVEHAASATTWDGFLKNRFKTGFCPPGVG